MAYDDKRWNDAWKRWVAHLRSGNPEPYSDVEEEKLDFRVCPGCGVEFILSSSSRRIHPESLNPHAICDRCWRERELLYPRPEVLTSADKTCEKDFLLDKRGVLKGLRWQARKNNACWLRQLTDSVPWRKRSATADFAFGRGYDAARHEAAILHWLRRFPQVGQNATKAVYTVRDILALHEIEDYDFPERLEFRHCHGCGGEHILRREHVLLYPHPCDPRPLCSNCEPSFERMRALASIYTNEGPFREPIPSVLDALPADQQPAISGASVVLEQALN